MSMAGDDRLVRVFAQLNRRMMLPMLRYPAVQDWMGSPGIGYFAVLTTTGRRSGLPRQTPLNYALLDGGIYLLAGFGPRSDWYRNLVANPEVTVRLPGRVVSGTAAPVTDPDEVARAMVAVARNSGFALVFDGLNPIGVSDDALLRQFAGRPVVRVDVDGGQVASGRHDPGSPLWLLPHVVAPAALIALARTLRRRARCGCAREYAVTTCFGDPSCRRQLADLQVWKSGPDRRRRTMSLPRDPRDPREGDRELARRPPGDLGT